jgi:hypothetical protein
VSSAGSGERQEAVSSAGSGETRGFPGRPHDVGRESPVLPRGSDWDCSLPNADFFGPVNFLPWVSWPGDWAGIPQGFRPTKRGLIGWSS